MIIDTCLILAGGRGSRLSEKTGEMPKPMLMVGDKPIIQHIIDHYVKHGVRNFVIPVGYLGGKVFEYFASKSDLIYEEFFEGFSALFVCTDKYTVTVVDTGEDTLTGTRILKCKDYLPTKFHYTYGDGISDVNISLLEATYIQSEATHCITAVHPEPRFGSLQISHDNIITKFGEKKDNLGWVNGGFGILSSSIFDKIEQEGENVNLEAQVFPKVVEAGHMLAVKHEGFWIAIDTIRDLEKAEECHSQKLF